MDVTGSRLDQMKMLVSKEDQHKNSQCDKQMKVQCNENYQRPSWLKGNTKSSSWPTPKVEKENSCVDKENVDPRVPFKNIYNNQNQFRHRQTYSPKKGSPSRRKWCLKEDSQRTIFPPTPSNSLDMVVDSCEISSKAKEDGFEDILNDNLVLDGGDEDMSPNEQTSTNSLSDSITGFKNGLPPSGSPTISSLLSRRVVLNNTNSSALNLLNDENGASPMLSLSQKNNRNGETFNSFRRCTSMIDQRQSPPIKDVPNTFHSSDDFTSPISRSYSGGTSSGFKRPLAFRRPNYSESDSGLHISCKNWSQQEVCADHDSTSIANSEDQDRSMRIESRSKRRRWDVDKCRPPLLKSHSMSAIGEETPSVVDEISSNYSTSCNETDSYSYGTKLNRSKSTIDAAAAAQIMEACSLAEYDPNRTGDTRRQLSLPVMQGHTKNQDLKNIDCHTMAKILKGELDDKVARCRIIDARYCYEYEGGHIKGAENFGMWEEETFLAEFFPPSLQEKSLTPKPLRSNDQENIENESDSTEAEKRDILVFHCEFSSARGPALMRLMRKKDREINKATYPALHYPECYLLHDGYKAFYEAYPQLCNGSYLPMKHPQFAHEERKFHKKSKSWAAGGGGTISRTGASSRLLKL